MRFIIHEGSVIELLILKRGFFFLNKAGMCVWVWLFQALKRDPFFHVLNEIQIPFFRLKITMYHWSTLDTSSSRDLTMPHLTSGPQYGHFFRGLNLFGIWLVAPPRNGTRVEERGKKKDAVRKQEDDKARNLFCNSVRDRLLASGNRVACIRG
jgi:hypothetical protein